MKNEQKKDIYPKCAPGETPEERAAAVLGAMQQRAAHGHRNRRGSKGKLPKT